MINYGWMGKILRVNLTNKKFLIEPLDKNLAKNFIGGRGFTSKILYDEVPRGTDPLGPNNKIVLAVGPFNGTQIPGSTRITIAAKSPLTGLIGDANSGGTMGAEIKYAGYDALIVEGKSQEPVYLWIDDNTIQFKSADHLWGKTTGETRRVIEKELGDPNVEVASIGPAGENLVPFANIISGVGRSHSRCGIGTVMGSKNLKAIVVRGSNGVKVANPELLQEIIKEMYKQYQNYFLNNPKRATTSTNSVVPYSKLGVLPTRNYQTGVFEGIENLDAEYFKSLFSVAFRSCFSCPLHEMQYWVIDQGQYKGTFTEGIQTMTLTMYGSNLGNSNPHSLVKMHQLGNELGLDIGNTAGVISWAIECFEKGILTLDDTGFLKLEWGNYKMIIELMKLIAYKEKFGKLLAKGVKRASEIIGKGSEKYAIQVKGLTIDSRDPRVFRGWGLGYAVASRGGEHCRADFIEEGTSLSNLPYVLSIDGKAEAVAWYEDMRAIQNSLEICDFCINNLLPTYKREIIPKILLKLFSSVTGLDINEDDFTKIGKRIINVERAFNIREGLTRKDDNLPERFLKEPLPEGPAKGNIAILDPLLDEYYEIRGWNKNTGYPTKTNLVNLNLNEVAAELEKLRKIS